MTPSLFPLLVSAAFSFTAALQAAPPATRPTLRLANPTWQAPAGVMLQHPVRDAEIHITFDGAEPKETDPEVESGETIVVDHPLTIKARAWLSDGTVSSTVVFPCPVTPSAGNRASIDDQSVPTFMAAGSRTTLGVSFRNVGTQPWTSGYVLASKKAKAGAKWGLTDGIRLTASIATWEVASFDVIVSAPAEPGTYSLQFELRAPDGTPIDEPTTLKRVEVVNPEEYERLLARFSGPREDEAPPGKAATSARQGTGQNPSLPQGIKEGSAAAQAFRELTREPRSFEDLRKAGLKLSDSELEGLAARNPSIFELTRLQRYENGKRIIPGWPALRLRPSQNIAPLPAGISPGSDAGRLCAELKRSARSYRYLRTVGFAFSDAQFHAFIERNPKVFASCRIIRRDDKGKRVIPGWPGIKLAR
jgi:hypothetical protein